MAASTPQGGGSHKESPAKALHINAWNLLLLIPMLMLVTPWFNFDSPRFLGMPFYYWYQFAWVPIGVICVAIVYLRTKDEPARPGPVAASNDREDRR